MDHAQKSLSDLLYDLAATIAKELNLPQPAHDDFDNTGHGFRDKFLPTVFPILEGRTTNTQGERNKETLPMVREGEEYPEFKIDSTAEKLDEMNRRLVLLFDEFDVLDAGAEEELEPTAAAFTFFPFLRNLMTNEPRLGFVFVLGRKAEDLSIEYKSTFNGSRFARVSVLDDEAARALVRNAERDDLLHFSDQAVTRVLSITARHPYFIQLTCQLLFERAYSNESQHVEITPADVDSIVPKVLEAGDPQFEWIWDGLPPAERVIFSAIASGTDEQTVISEGRITPILQSQGIRILIRELELAPKTLVEWEMLKQTNGGYKFFIELLRRWIVERKPLAKVKEELDRIVPLANSLYQAANGFYRRGDLEPAITQLQSALNVNPNHFKARLLLGEIYRMQGDFDEAARELEEAYKIDDDGTRIALERVLMQRAGKLEKVNRTDDALRDYDRVLEVSPFNAAAKEQRISIWLSRGEEALNANDLQTARKAFEEADASIRVSEIDALERKSRHLQLVEMAEGLAGQEKWEEVIAVYQRLAALDGEDKDWQKGLEWAQQESKIARRYAEGLGALQQKKWAEAQRAFADVIYARPDYKEAAQFLAEAVQHSEQETTPNETQTTQVGNHTRKGSFLPYASPGFWLIMGLSFGAILSVASQTIGVGIVGFIIVMLVGSFVERPPK